MVIIVRGGGDNKGEEKILIINKVQKNIYNELQLLNII